MTLIVKRKKMAFFSVLFTFFVDNLGWSIVFPIFAPLFLDQKNVLLSPNMSFAGRTTLLGFFLAAFPLAQFFGSPLLGEFADKAGRKKAFVLSIFLTFIGYVLTGWSISINSLVFLFIGRVITGVFSGNLSVCLACISDFSEDEKARVKNFGYLSMLGGFSFILGAFIGGKFSDHLVSKYFSFSLPLWIASALSLINLLFIILAFKETCPLNKNVKYNFFEGFNNIKIALKTKKLKSFYLIYFLFLFGWTILFQFTPVLVIKRFSFSNSAVGDLAAFMGICWALGSLFTNKFLSRRFALLRILEISLIIFTVLCGFVGFPRHVIGVLLLLAVCVVIGGIMWPVCAGVLSGFASKQMQGKVMGMSQSMQSLAMAISPIVGGLAAESYIHVPFLIAAAASLLASLLYFRIKL